MTQPAYRLDQEEFVCLDCQWYMFLERWAQVFGTEDVPVAKVTVAIPESLPRDFPRHAGGSLNRRVGIALAQRDGHVFSGLRLERGGFDRYVKRNRWRVVPAKKPSVIGRILSFVAFVKRRG